MNNKWSSRELERQTGSFLYERLALSKDKKGLMKLAHKGQELQKYEDMIKDPMFWNLRDYLPIRNDMKARWNRH